MPMHCIHIIYNKLLHKKRGLKVLGLNLMDKTQEYVCLSDYHEINIEGHPTVRILFELKRDF